MKMSQANQTYIKPRTTVEYAGYFGTVIHSPYKECFVQFASGECVWLPTCDLIICEEL